MATSDVDDVTITTPRSEVEMEMESMICGMRETLLSFADQLSKIREEDSSFGHRVAALESALQNEIKQLQGCQSSMQNDIELLKRFILEMPARFHRSESLTFPDQFEESNPGQLRKSLSQNALLSKAVLEGPRRPLVLAGGDEGSRSTSDSGILSSQHPQSSETSCSIHSGRTSPTEGIEVNLEDGYTSDSSISRRAQESLMLCQSLQQSCLLETSSVQDQDQDEQNSDDQDPDHDLSAAKVDFPETKLTSCQMIRHRAVVELVDTERRYCNGLWNLQENFAAPLAHSGLIPTKDLKILFPEEMTRIYEHHCILLHKLEERLAHWNATVTSIGDLFICYMDTDTSMLPNLYRDYVADFPAISKVFQRYFCRETKVRRFLRMECQVKTMTLRESKSAQPFQLDSFLLSPVQRVPRYVLLLKRILKQTPPEHPDAVYLRDALEKIGSFLVRLNDSISHSCQSFTAKATTLILPQKPKRKKFSSFDANTTGSSASSEISSTFHISPSMCDRWDGGGENPVPIGCDDGGSLESQQVSTSWEDEESTQAHSPLSLSPSHTDQHQIEPPRRISFQDSWMVEEGSESPRSQGRSPTSELDRHPRHPLRKDLCISEPMLNQQIGSHLMENEGACEEEYEAVSELGGRGTYAGTLGNSPIRSHSVSAVDLYTRSVKAGAPCLEAKARRRKKIAVTKNIASVRNSVLAFFSKRKNEKLFGQPQHVQVPGSVAVDSSTDHSSQKSADSDPAFSPTQEYSAPLSLPPPVLREKRNGQPKMGVSARRPQSLVSMGTLPEHRTLMARESDLNSSNVSDAGSELSTHQPRMGSGVPSEPPSVGRSYLKKEAVLRSLPDRELLSDWLNQSSVEQKRSNHNRPPSSNGMYRRRVSTPRTLLIEHETPVVQV